MVSRMGVVVAMLALSACASQDRLMDAGVRPADRPDCLVGNDPLDDGSKGTRSARHERCNPERSLKWSSEQSRDKPMEMDFRKKND